MNTKTKITALATTILLLVGFAGPSQATPEKQEPASITQSVEIPVSAPVISLTFDKVSVETFHVPAYVASTPVADAPVVPQSAPTAPVRNQQPQTEPTTQTVPVKAATTSVASSGKGALILAAAQAQLGVAQDCTALVTNSLTAVGINFHGWPAGYLSLGPTVSAAEAQPGDLVYYQNGGMGLAHIAVYVGNGMAVHGGWDGGTTVLYSVNVGSGPVFIRVA